ncbi:MAG: hypothetical protein HY755_12815 [Nitrospirae bacterium]|nr:hypothetical protein [Nitrospirota bacterium]
MRGMKVFLAAMLSVCMVIGFGCSYKSIKHGEEISDEQVAKIIDGKTTKEEIFIEFGNPSKTMDNEKVFFYNWTRGSKSSLLGLGGGSAYTHSLVIVFDEKGTVKSHKITRGATEGGVSVHD